MPYHIEIIDNATDRASRAVISCRYSLPHLDSGQGRDRINGFLSDFVAAYRGWVAGILLPRWKELYESSDRTGRIRSFPAHLRMSALCRERGQIFSVHFSVELSPPIGNPSVELRSFVFDADRGLLLRLRDLSDLPDFPRRRLPAGRWRFYLAGDGWRFYRTDRSGRIRKQLRLEDESEE